MRPVPAWPGGRGGSGSFGVWSPWGTVSCCVTPGDREERFLPTSYGSHVLRPLSRGAAFVVKGMPLG